jgi:YaiO family outer membrane protein
MRTVPAVGFAAGVLCLNAAVSIAAEGSELRGLKPPPAGVASVGPVQAAAQQGLRGGPIDLTAQFAARLALDGGYTLESERTAVGPFDIRTALHQPAGQNIASLADAYANALHEALPRYTLSNQINRALPGGWGLGLGVRQNEYSYITTNLLSFSAEHAWGNLRSGYTLYSSRADGSGLGSAHRLQVSYAYGDRNSVGLAYTVGRDIENPALMLGMPLADVKDLTLSGRHWLSPNWALTYDLLSQEHAYLNRRQGMRLGVSRSF